MDICRQVGANVRRLREQKGWSQEELGHQTGLHRTYISGIERGVRNPTVTIVARIASPLGVKTGELLEGYGGCPICGGFMSPGLGLGRPVLIAANPNYAR